MACHLYTIIILNPFRVRKLGKNELQITKYYLSVSE